MSLHVACETARPRLKTEDPLHFVGMQGPHGSSVVSSAASAVTAEVLPGGALQLTSDGIVVTVVSTFSVPGHSYHTHYNGPSRAFNHSVAASAGWKVSVQPQPAGHGSIIGTVTGTCDLFRVDRVYFRAQDGFIKVNDTITAASEQQLVGVQQRHYASVRPAAATITEVVGPGSLQVGECSTSGISGVATEAAEYGEMIGIPYYVGTEGNPSVFASIDAVAANNASMGVGLLALDDVFMVHAETANHATAPCNTTATTATPWAPGIELADPHFGLRGGARHTLEWAIFAAGSGCSSYYCFVNQVRRHQAMNDITIQRQGVFDHQWIGLDLDGSPRPYGDWRNWTVEKTRRIIKENGLKYIISAIPWTNKTSVCEQNNWKYAQGSAFVHEASPTFDQYIRDLVRVFTAADPDFKVLVYFHSFESGETNASQKYYSDRILRADLTQQCYGRCCAEWPLFFPATLKGGQPSPYAQQLDLYLDKVFALGAHGLYHDESSYSLNPYTFLLDDSRWDGVSVAFNWSLFPVAKISSGALLVEAVPLPLLSACASDERSWRS